jgi:hypothetical protein
VLREVISPLESTLKLKPQQSEQTS